MRFADPEIGGQFRDAVGCVGEGGAGSVGALEGGERGADVDQLGMGGRREE